jgi:uncharacterized membrane protein YcaP (DUF421 family)
MEREQLSHHELNAPLRAAGCAACEEVHYAILENTGRITVQPCNRRRQNEPLTDAIAVSLVAASSAANSNPLARRAMTAIAAGN